jgi:hypothetical protein
LIALIDLDYVIFSILFVALVDGIINLCYVRICMPLGAIVKLTAVDSVEHVFLHWLGLRKECIYN